MDPGDDRVSFHSSSSSSKDDLKNIDDNRIGRRHSSSKNDTNDITDNTTKMIQIIQTILNIKQSKHLY